LPELPELEMLRRYLQAECLGRTITGVTVNQPACVNLPPEQYAEVVVGGRFEHVWRKGKLVGVDLSRPVSLLVHLALGGGVLLKDSPEHDPRRTQIVFTLADGTALHVHELRLGNVHVWPTRRLLESRLGALGLDALDELPAPGDLQLIYVGRPGPLKALLLDQSLLCGIGNLYGDEILFRAGLHPQVRAKTLAPADFARLHEAIGAVLAEAIEQREAGEEFRAQVYGCNGQSCSRCGTVVERVRINNRSAHFCPRCQAAP
jgi:formamidopyrimidine-DNA glycosylase